MKKRLLSALLACVLALALLPGAALAATPGLSNFTKSNTYTAGLFSDVASGQWYSSAVQSAYEYGLMEGGGGGTFNLNGQLTIAETITIAARLHAIYQGNGDTFAAGSPWYQPYVDYAVANGISSTYPDYSAQISRAAFVMILSNAFPDEALAAKNTIADNSIPDIPADANYYQAAYRFYRAGVLSGTDEAGTFAPFKQITRAEVAVILSSMVDPSLRKSFTLSATPVTLYKSRYEKVSVLPNQVSTYLAQGWSRTRPAAVTRNTPIRIRTQPVIEEINSAGGVNFTIAWQNNSSKTIKYAHFYVTPYNGVWDPLKCEIRDYSQADCYVTGPISKVSASTDLLNTSSGNYKVLVPQDPYGQGWDNNYMVGIGSGPTFYNSYTQQMEPVNADVYPDVFLVTYWECTWYNDQTRYLLINKVVLEYMDGTKTTLTGDALSNCFY